MTRRVLEKLCTKKVCVDFLGPTIDMRTQSRTLGLEGLTNLLLSDMIAQGARARWRVRPWQAVEPSQGCVCLQDAHSSCEQRHFYANKAKTEMRHLCFKHYKIRKNPHAHKNKIGTSTPPPSKKNHDPPPKRRNFMGMGVFQQKEPQNARRP